MSGEFSKLLGILSLLLVAALGFVAFAVFMLLAGWNNWFPFDGEDQPDRTVLSFAENGEIQRLVFSESKFNIPDVLTVWETVSVEFNSESEFRVLSQVTIAEAENLGFTKVELESDKGSEYYRLEGSQFRFEDGKANSCRIDCDSFKSVRLQLAEGSKIFSLPVSESEFSRLLADARKRNRTKK